MTTPKFTPCKTLIAKDLEKTIKSSKISSRKKSQIKCAIQDIHDKDLAQLKIFGKVRKMSGKHTIPLYVYRLNPHERIVFSIENGSRKIHDIVDLQNGQSIKK